MYKFMKEKNFIYILNFIYYEHNRHNSIDHYLLFKLQKYNYTHATEI